MKIVRFSGGFLLGALVGGGLVLLLAPRSGLRTRVLVEHWLREVWREGEEAAQSKRQELLSRLEDLQAPGR